MVKEKAYCRDAEEHSERWEYQRKFRVDMNRLIWAMLDGEGKGEETREQGAAARRPDVPKGRGG